MICAYFFLIIVCEIKTVCPQAEYEALQRSCDAEVGRLQKELNTALESILNHKLGIRKVRALAFRVYFQCTAYGEVFTVKCW